MDHRMTYTFGAGRDPGLRASDADREQISEQLRRQHAEGRLDVEELQERIDRCYQSKTVGELAELVRDLPSEVEPERDRAGLSVARRLLALPLPVLLLAFAVAAGAAAAATGRHGPHGFWVVIPLLFIARLWFWRRPPWRASWGHPDL
jgi:hypothetical protein